MQELLLLLGLEKLVESQFVGGGKSLDGAGDTHALDKSLNIGFDLEDALLLLALQSLHAHDQSGLFLLLLHESARYLPHLRRLNVGIAQDEVIADSSRLLPLLRHFILLWKLALLCRLFGGMRSRMRMGMVEGLRGSALGMGEHLDCWV